jgi:hypothetical protein
MTCAHLVDSGVYVLGALAPAQRIAFEQHMATCAECQAEVNELAVLPGLLGRLDDPSITATDDLPPPSVLPMVLAKVHRQRRGRRVLAGVAAVVLAALALVAGLNLPEASSNHPVIANPPASAVPISPSPFPSAPSSSAPPTATVTMHDMISVNPVTKVSAQVGFTPVIGGTQIALKCQYPVAFGHLYHGKKWFGLFAIPRNGKPAQELSTWGAKPGDEIPVPATLTSWSVDQMSRLELRDSDGHTLLYYNF